MKPHIEEAWRSLRLADRDIQAFDVLRSRPEIHPSVAYFHAQQAVEKALKAVLFSHQVEFERIHDLVKLAQLLGEQDIVLPVSEDELRRLNPFAVAFRYDDVEIEIDAVFDAAPLVAQVRRWAGEQVDMATEEESSGADKD